jgi:hypothetical protein
MHVADPTDVFPNQPPHMHRLMSSYALPPSWRGGGSWSGLSAAGWSIGLHIILITRGRCRHFVRGGRFVTPLLTPFTGGGAIIITICNLNNRLLGIQCCGCGGLSTHPQFNTRLLYIFHRWHHAQFAHCGCCQSENTFRVQCAPSSSLSYKHLLPV